jgi:hypothetical protein
VEKEGVEDGVGRRERRERSKKEEMDGCDFVGLGTYLKK